MEDGRKIKMSVDRLCKLRWQMKRKRRGNFLEDYLIQNALLYRYNFATGRIDS